LASAFLHQGERGGVQKEEGTIERRRGEDWRLHALFTRYLPLYLLYLLTNRRQKKRKGKNWSLKPS